MSNKISSVRGMNDLLPPESAKWHFFESRCRAVLARHGYAEIRTPVVESTALFARGIGEATDIVEKEMYTFLDRGDRSLTMRPEMTASCARAYVEHSLHMREPVTRWFYIAPMFRYERMQTGRYRQFWQVGAEAYGIAEPTIDAEQIAMLHALYLELGVPGLSVSVNSVGAGDDRPRYRQALVDYLSPHRAALCADCQRRLETNPLRILDCKVPTCKTIIAGAPSILDHLGAESRGHFEAVQAALAVLGVPFHVDPSAVRGLDYYTGTVFELVSSSSELGTQNVLAGGGRYDTLIERFGGPAIPAVGWALGIERAILTIPGDAATLAGGPVLYIAALGKAARLEAMRLAAAVRATGAWVEIEHREVGMKAQFKRADKLGARFTLAIGDDELGSGRGQIRDMRGGQQTELALADIATVIARLTAA